ncbi:MAG: hypothetical protein ACYC2I_13305 [Elusimicrobiales bacterium]
MWESAISGLIGAIVGVVGTVWATYATIKFNANEYNRQRSLEKEEDYRDKLCNLKAEVDFNINLTGDDKKLPVFISAAWTNFLPVSHKLKIENRLVLNEAYSWALFHNNAAQLDVPNVTAYGKHIADSYDKTVAKLKEFKKMQFGE